MAALVILPAARVPEVVATVVDPGALHPRRALLRALEVAVAAIAVGPLVVETGETDRPIPSQTSAALAAAGRDPHLLRVREAEGPLPPVFRVLPTAVDLKVQALPLMPEGVEVALVVVGVAPLVPVRAILHRRWGVTVALEALASALIILMVRAVAAVAAMTAVQAMAQVVGEVD
jgi:hypothetical protein